MVWFITMVMELATEHLTCLSTNSHHSATIPNGTRRKVNHLCHYRSSLCLLEAQYLRLHFLNLIYGQISLKALLAFILLELYIARVGLSIGRLLQ
jgi:hypothetical protein